MIRFSRSSTNCWSEASALHRGRIVFANVGQPAVQGRLVGVFEQDRNAGIGKYHGDAAAHGACANHRGGINRDSRRFFGNVRDFGDFTLAEENVDERLRLIGVETVDKQSGFGLAAFLERQSGGGFDGIDGGQRSDQVALLLAGGFAGGGKNRRVLLGCAQLLIALASFGGGLACDLAGESDGAFQQIAVDQLIHDAGLEGVRGFNRISAGTHLNSHGDSGKARQALRAGGPGNEAEFHFRLSDLGSRRGHTVVAGHGHLQAAAEGRAVNRHDHRLGTVFYLQQQGQQSRAGLSALPEVILVNSLMSAPAMKVRPPPITTAAITELSLVDLIDGVRNSFGDAGAYGIHRRIIDGDDGDVAVFRKLDEVAHLRASLQRDG